MLRRSGRNLVIANLSKNHIFAFVGTFTGLFVDVEPINGAAILQNIVGFDFVKRETFGNFGWIVFSHQSGHVDFLFLKCRKICRIHLLGIKLPAIDFRSEIPVFRIGIALESMSVRDFVTVDSDHLRLSGLTLSLGFLSLLCFDFGLFHWLFLDRGLGGFGRFFLFSLFFSFSWHIVVYLFCKKVWILLSHCSLIISACSIYG